MTDQGASALAGDSLTQTQVIQSSDTQTLIYAATPIEEDLPGSQLEAEMTAKAAAASGLHALTFAAMPPGSPGPGGTPEPFQEEPDFQLSPRVLTSHKVCL